MARLALSFLRQTFLRPLSLSLEPISSLYQPLPLTLLVTNEYSKANAKWIQLGLPLKYNFHSRKATSFSLSFNFTSSTLNHSHKTRVIDIESPFFANLGRKSQLLH